MTKRFATATSVSIVALMCAGTAGADVTAQEVWDKWAESMEVYGDSGVTYDEPVMEGDALVIRNLQLSLSEADGTVQGSMGDIRLVENGDGTVSLEMADENRFTFSPGPEISDQDRADLVIRYTGLQTTVSGDPEAMTFDVSFDRQELSLDGIVAEGQPIDGVARMALNGGAGSYAMTSGDLTGYVGDVSATGLEILVDFDVPEQDAVLFLSGKIENLAVTFDVDVPADFDTSAPPEEMATIFQDGLDVSFGYSTGPVAYMFSTDDGTMTASGTATAASAETSLAVNADSAGYSTRVTGLDVSFESSDLPFPVQLSAAEYGLGVDLPLSSTDEPADFSASVNLTDVAVNDMIWMMVDPQAQLSHDPATVIVDLSGTARLLFDLLDPAQAEALGAAAMPAELHSLSLDDLRVSIAGGELTGAGAFTFDNSDMMTFGGMPRPEGQASLKLMGGNALLDGLIAMGLVGESEAMQTRMMMGMFTTATGDDQLETTVEVNDQGHLIVNGQRLQ